MQLDNMIEDLNYKKLVEKQLTELMEYLIEINQPFNVVCNLEAINFEPRMPDSIYKNFNPLTLFAMSGYTLETVQISDNKLTFEAGFGSGGFSSVVTIPLFAIMQIVLEDNVIFVNILAGSRKYLEEQKNKKGYIKSQKAFLTNSKNSKLLNNLRT